MSSVSETNDLTATVHNEWTIDHEDILVSWADKAMCYKWLHSKSNAKYTTLNTWYTIPVIIISTVTGTANFAQNRVSPEYQYLFAMIIGTFNILAGIITTIQQFLKITQLNEAHRVSDIAWGKFNRNIIVELKKHPSERIDPKHMLKVCKEEFDRMIETSPPIPSDIIKLFKTKFNDSEVYHQITKPEICDTLIPTETLRNNWHSDDYQMEIFRNSIKNSLMKQNKLSVNNNAMTNNNLIINFIRVFNVVNNRNPSELEIITNLEDKIEISKIKEILSELYKNESNV